MLAFRFYVGIAVLALLKQAIRFIWGYPFLNFYRIALLSYPDLKDSRLGLLIHNKPRPEGLTVV